MSYASEREAFIARILSETECNPTPPGFTLPSFPQRLDLARSILRDAQVHDGIAVAECNRELTTRDHSRREGCRKRIAAALADLGPGFGVAEFSGDPRGCTVKIRLPSGYGDSWGDRTMLCVPVRE